MPGPARIGAAPVTLTAPEQVFLLVGKSRVNLLMNAWLTPYRDVVVCRRRYGHHTARR